MSKRSLSNAFEKLDTNVIKTEQSNVTVLSNNEKENNDVQVLSNNSTVEETVLLNTPIVQENEPEIVISNHDTDKTDEIDKHKNVTGKSEVNVSENEFINRIKEKSNRLTVEDTHTRQTYLIRNDLLKRLEKLSKKQKRGFKTELINYALDKVMKELEE